MTQKVKGGTAWEQVRKEELAWIERARRTRAKVGPKLSEYSKPAGEHIFGLAFSGGGIRSATFNLGVLQGLARSGVLSCVDVLSLVSGGGYIGGWYSAWLHHASRNKAEGKGLQEVQTALGTGTPGARGSEEAAEVAFLRQYSNFLTPRMRLFGADAWMAGSSYVRNLTLNLLVLVLAAIAILGLPHVILAMTPVLVGSASKWSLVEVSSQAPFIVGLIALAIGAVSISSNLRRIARRGAVSEATTSDWKAGSTMSQRNVQCFVVIPFLIAAISAAIASSIGAPENPLPEGLPWATGWIETLAARTLRLEIASTRIAIGFSLALIVPWVFYAFSFLQQRRATARRWGRDLIAILLSSIAATSLAGLLIHATLPRLFSTDLSWSFAVLPATLIAFLYLAGVLHIGFCGRALGALEREWFSRMAGWMLIYTLGWTGAFALAHWAPAIWDALGPLSISVLGSGWTASVLSVALGGGGAEGNRVTTLIKRVLITRVAPLVIVAGLLLAVALGVHALIGTPQALLILIGSKAAWSPLSISVALVVASALIAIVLSARIDVNTFSMHDFYRYRLMRCYLGASNDARSPEAFTHFDPKDEIALDKIGTLRTATQDEESPDRRHSGAPFPLLNGALNLVDGGNLAWQDRKAASFFFSPLYSGYQIPEVDEIGGAGGKELVHAFQPSQALGAGRSATPGAMISDAMTISGAAAAPNMGQNSSPLLAFLMTVFNVRLGKWIGNPRFSKHWQFGAPRFGVFWLLYELFGLTSSRKGFVYLSDGGHFENLGVYELLRRRCRAIVVADATMDPKSTFGDLGNLVRKARVDFGIEINIDSTEIREKRSGHAVGRIQYTDGSIGKLLYIKPTLTGDEPADVAHYARSHPNFPHETTADQWLDESQFESYRKLGEQSVLRIFANAGSKLENEGSLEELFDELVGAKSERVECKKPMPESGAQADGEI